MIKYKTIKQISLQDWDNLVKSTYNKIYSLQQQDGCMYKGTTIEFTVPVEKVEDYERDKIPFEINLDERGVSFISWLNTNPEDTAKHFEHNYQNELFWQRTFYPNLTILINDLYDRELIEEGEYSILIDW